MSVYDETLKDFESAVRKRKPLLAERLNPGLPEARIGRSMLKEGIKGDVESVVAVFHWKNGTGGGRPCEAIEEVSLFPGSTYMLTEFAMMLAYFRCFGEMASYHPRYSIVIGRYFPIFWNGSTDFVAVDLNDSGGNRVVLIEHETENLIRVIYPTFKAFLVDAIRSNETNEILACFQTGPSN